MNRPLPLILSIPHGGTEIPATLQDNFRLTHKEVLEDGDLWTKDLFDFSGDVLHTSRMPLARAVLDLNRHPSDRPPYNPDGVVKSHSLKRAPIWTHPLEPHAVEWLIRTYYHPYYETLIEASSLKGAKLGIDCHSMLPHDPFDVKSLPRPMFCLSNRGEGELPSDSLTAPMPILREFKTILESVFGQGTVSINIPFQGGELIRRLAQDSKIPWFQFEVNRSLYAPFGVDGTSKKDYALYALKTKLSECLKRLARSL